MKEETNRAQWLAERATGIGGSDAAAVCKMSPWATPLDVYLSKVEPPTEDSENADMRRGHLMEPVVLQMYTDETGTIVHKPADALVSDEHPFMRANLDGETAGRGRIIEAKTARNRAGWGEPWSDEIPLAYLFQCQHNMAVACANLCDIPVLFGNFEFAVYTVEADREFQDLMIEHEAAFWQMVEARTPPEPINDADVSKRWPISRAISRKATQSDLEIGGHLLAVREYYKQLEALKESLEAELKRSMEEVEELIAGEETICTWKTAKKGVRRFDAKRFRKEHPDLYMEFSSESAPTRRFLFKEGAKALEIMKPLLQENLLPDRKLIGE